MGENTKGSTKMTKRKAGVSTPGRMASGMMGTGGKVSSMALGHFTIKKENQLMASGIKVNVSDG